MSEGSLCGFGPSRRVTFTILACVCVAVLQGCTFHRRTPVDTAAHVGGQTSASVQTDRVFQYRRHEIVAENHVIGAGANHNYAHRELTFPSIGDNGQTGSVFKANFFQSTAAGVHPLVIVLPIWAGPDYPSDKISSYLQKHAQGSVHVLDVLGEESPINLQEIAAAHDEQEFLELCRLGVEREIVTVKDIRRMLDWAEQRPEIDGSRVALVGFSHGAMLGAVVAAQEPRLTATVLVMGSADAHQVIARCEGKKTTAIQQRAETFGWDSDHLEELLEPIFRPVNASTYPGRVDPTDVIIFESGKDGCMPAQSRENLWQAMGRPERVTISFGHRTSFVSMTFLGGNMLCRKTWKFLEHKLLEQDSPS